MVGKIVGKMLCLFGLHDWEEQQPTVLQDERLRRLVNKPRARARLLRLHVDRLCVRDGCGTEDFALEDAIRALEDTIHPMERK